MDIDSKFLREVERVAIKHAHSCNHTVFLKRCVQESIVPKGLRWNIAVQSPVGLRIKKEAERQLVRERLQYWKRRRAFLFEKLMGYRATLMLNSEREDSAQNWRLVLDRKEIEFQRTKVKQLRKFAALKDEKLALLERSSPCKSNNFADDVVNLSSVFLSDVERRLLGKGLKFVPTHAEVPYEEFIVRVE